MSANKKGKFDSVTASKEKKILGIVKPIGFLLAVALAVIAYLKFGFIALSLFVFFMVMLISVRIGEIIVFPNRIRRTIFGTLMPVSGVLILYYTYQLWGMMWLSAILGFIGGTLVSMILGLMFFRGITDHEQKRKEMRIKEMGEEDVQSKKMRERFTEFEWKQLKHLPNIIFYGVAAVDDKIDKRETKAFGESVAYTERYDDPLWRAILIDIRSSLFRKEAGAISPPEKFEEISEIWDILSGELDREEYIRFLRNIILFGRNIAYYKDDKSVKLNETKFLVQIIEIGIKAAGISPDYLTDLLPLLTPGGPGKK